jgi:hypothetical protein
MGTLLAVEPSVPTKGMHMNTPTRLAAAAALLLIPSAALAQEAEAPEASPVEAMVSSTADPGQLLDSKIDRAFLLPTAQTHPAGSITFNDYELFFVGVTYGVTDDFQITGTTLVPITDETPFMGILSGKYRVPVGDRLRLAGQASVILGNPDWSLDDDDASATAYTLGGIASYCLDEGCGSLASLSVTSMFSPAAEDSAGFIYGASIIQRLNRRVKLMFELDSLAVKVGDEWETADGALLSYGLRFYSGEISGDIGFIKPVGGDGDDDFVMGLPFVNFTYRAL